MAVRNPDIIRAGAEAFGTQCIVLSTQVKHVGESATLPSGYEVFIDGARTATGMDAIEWVRRGADLGAGEIVVNSIDADGTAAGYELAITARGRRRRERPGDRVGRRRHRRPHRRRSHRRRRQRRDHQLDPLLPPPRAERRRPGAEDRTRPSVACTCGPGSTRRRGERSADVAALRLPARSAARRTTVARGRRRRGSRRGRRGPPARRSRAAPTTRRSAPRCSAARASASILRASSTSSQIVRT